MVAQSGKLHSRNSTALEAAPMRCYLGMPIHVPTQKPFYILTAFS